MGTYSPRVAALEAGFKAGTCSKRLCLKCVIASLPVVRVPGFESDDPLVSGWTGATGIRSIREPRFSSPWEEKTMTNYQQRLERVEAAIAPKDELIVLIVKYGQTNTINAQIRREMELPGHSSPAIRCIEHARHKLTTRRAR